MPSPSSTLKSLLDHPMTFPVLVVGALLSRLVFILVLGDAPLEGDAQWYAQAASEWVEGKGYDSYWPPGVPAWLALFDLPFGLSDQMARLSMIPFLLLFLLQLRRALLPITGNAFSNGILLLFSIFPAFILHSLEPLSQLPAAFLLLLAWNESTAFRQKNRPRHLWTMGIALGLLFLFRPSALILLLWPLALAFSGIAKRKKPEFRWLIPLLPALAILIATSTAISRSQDRPILLNDANARNFYLGNNEWTPDYKTWYYGSHWAYDPAHPAGFREQLEAIEALPIDQQSDAFFGAAWEDIRHRPAHFTLRTANRARVFFAFDSMTASRLQHKGHTLFAVFSLGLDALCFFLLLALALAALFSPAPFPKILSGIVLLYALPYCFSFSHPTFHLPIVPLLAVMAATYWRSRKDKPIWPRHRKVGLAIALGIALLIQIEWVFHLGSAWLA